MRLRDDSSSQTPLVTDIVATFPHTSAVPEPTSLALLGTGDRGATYLASPS